LVVRFEFLFKRAVLNYLQWMIENTWRLFQWNLLIIKCFRRRIQSRRKKWQSWWHWQITAAQFFRVKKNIPIIRMHVWNWRNLRHKRHGSRCLWSWYYVWCVQHSIINHTAFLARRWQFMRRGQLHQKLTHLFVQLVTLESCCIRRRKRSILITIDHWSN
jgi:hypothetical protein